MTYFAGIEAGGTKFVCGIGSGPSDLRKTEFPTTTAAETLGRTVDWIREQARGHAIHALGVASFGPIDLAPSSATFGYITSTPKPGWRNFDIVGELKRALGVPVIFDTDVNAAMLAEARWGAAAGLSDAVYVTVGTGIGGGALAGGKLLHGALHPEMGHLLIPRDHRRDPFPGVCPFHGDCLEGLASGPAIAKRWGVRGEDLPPDHPAWALEAHYLALGLVNIALTLSPERIILGGGVLRNGFLFQPLRQELKRLLNGYLQWPAVLNKIDCFLVPALLGDSAGVLGALALAQEEYE